MSHLASPSKPDPGGVSTVGRLEKSLARTGVIASVNFLRESVYFSWLAATGSAVFASIGVACVRMEIISPVVVVGVVGGSNDADDELTSWQQQSNARAAFKPG